MRKAIYPGSFNPWHKGHQEVLEKALEIFDTLIVGIGVNVQKDAARGEYPSDSIYRLSGELIKYTDVSDPRRLPQIVTMQAPGKKTIIVKEFWGLLTEFAKEEGADAIVRGLRNIEDFEKEKIQQYNYEDFGLEIPVLYFISGRENTHISSTSERIKAFWKKDET